MGEIPAHRWAELRAIPESAVTRVNLNVPLVVATVLAVAPKVRALRAEIHAAIRKLNFDWIDGLEDYALILNRLHGELLTTPKTRRAVSVAGEARKLRRHLTSWLRLLVQRGVIPRAQCPKLSGSNGHVAIATDLGVLARVLGKHYSAPDPTGLAALGDLKTARVLSMRMLRTGEERSHRGIAKGAALDMCARAFTALLRAYDEARFAVMFLRRWEGDADSIIPSLYAVRFKRKRPVVPSERVEDSQRGASLADSSSETAAENKEQGHT
jgi:hypothetical protein